MMLTREQGSSDVRFGSHGAHGASSIAAQGVAALPEWRALWQPTDSGKWLMISRLRNCISVKNHQLADAPENLSF